MIYTASLSSVEPHVQHHSACSLRGFSFTAKEWMLVSLNSETVDSCCIGSMNK